MKYLLMRRVRLIHWNAAESAEKAEKLRAAGYDVIYEPLTDAAAVSRLRVDPPTAVVIDLARLPAQGRDVGVVLRRYKTTRHVPLVFVGGDPQKVARIKELLPDAVYTDWGRLRCSLKQAIAHPVTNPVVPASSLAGYSGTPSPKKLGIRENSVVILVDAPQGFERTLGDLPQGAKFRKQARGRCDLVVWFSKSRKDIERHVEKMGDLAGSGGLWIVWPKKASGIETDLSQTVVREVGLAAGLVDYKVAAIDATWTGLRFTRRKSK